MHPLPPHAQAAVRQGDLMTAIERTRAATGMDLGASMQAVVVIAVGLRYELARGFLCPR